jgi:hypothetical protein
MNRRERQNAPSSCSGSWLSTQAEVASALKESGFEVVQTTVSRDIADLGLVKVRAPSGRLIYAPPGSTDADRLRALGAAMRRYAMALRRWIARCSDDAVRYANALAQAIDEAAHRRRRHDRGDNHLRSRPRRVRHRLETAFGNCSKGRVSKTAVSPTREGSHECIRWLKEDWYGYEEVVAVLVDVGQEFDLEESIARAKAAGADDVLLVDRKDTFADEQCARAILTNALYEGKYPLVSALSRPVIAGSVAEIALELGAEAVVHGCTGKGNDQLRFELAFKAHYPGVKVIAPLRDRIWTRDEEIEYPLPRDSRGANGRIALLDRRTSLAARSGRCARRPWARRPRAVRLHPTRKRKRRWVVSDSRRAPISLGGDDLSLPDRATNRLAGAWDRADRHDREPRCRHQGARSTGAGP